LGVGSDVLAEFIELDQPLLERDAQIGAWYAGERQRPFFRMDNSRPQSWQALRPRVAWLQEVGRSSQGAPTVSDTSNAQLVWSSHLQAPHGGKRFEPPRHVGITALI